MSTGARCRRSNNARAGTDDSTLDQLPSQDLRDAGAGVATGRSRGAPCLRLVLGGRLGGGRHLKIMTIAISHKNDNKVDVT